MAAFIELIISLLEKELALNHDLVAVGILSIIFFLLFSWTMFKIIQGKSSILVLSPTVGKAITS